jgi:mono/diheme cytochrome c family protein
MRRLAIALGSLFGLATLISAQGGPVSQGPPRAGTGAATAPVDVSADDPSSVFRQYCFECHGAYKPEANLSIEELLGSGAFGEHFERWEKIADAIESEVMPPFEASAFPSIEERQAAADWVRRSLDTWAQAHAGEPGRVTVRRLTSAEYAYAIEDLTGVPLRVGIDASSDSVGGEGFSNFGDVQFVEDTSIERYLEAAKVVADHAMIGSGPLAFHADAGQTGLELFALERINTLYAEKGFRVVSGEGGRPFGLERYGKAFYAAWYFRHRETLGEPGVTVRDLAEREGITGRFAEHIWTVVNRTDLKYPSREMVDRWRALPVPAADIEASKAAARAAVEELSDHLTTWPSWFFARGDLAAGGAGDESPLVFTDEALAAQPSREYSYTIGPRPARGRGPVPAENGPATVHLLFANINQEPGVNPVIIWRNARIVTRQAGGRGRGAGVGRGAGPAPVLASVPLREALAPDEASRLGFGTSPDGTTMGPEDFAVTGPTSLTIDTPIVPGTLVAFEAEAELGADRNGVVRVMISNTPEGGFRDVGTRTIFADLESEGYRSYRAAMAEYAALMPPNSHGEANPADKDPVPAPFDNTYNSPEHDAFVLRVKYQRSDEFFTANMVDGADRDRLEHAWNDLLGSWPYHDAYLGMLAEHYGYDLGDRRMADIDAAAIAQLPAEMQQYVTPLREHYEKVRAAMKAAEPAHVDDAVALASRAWRRPLTEAETSRLRAFYDRARRDLELPHQDAIRLLIARILVSPAFLYRFEAGGDGAAQSTDNSGTAGALRALSVGTAAATERPLTDWELASRLSFFLWASIPDEELRRAANAGELRETEGLTRQVRRMLADPKSRRLSAEFFGQWLGFYRFDRYGGVDTTRFPDFTEAVRQAMHLEAVETFDYIVRQERPLRELIDADYTFLNRDLARFYGLDLDLPESGEMVRVDGAGRFNRGGLLRLGSVLTVTSAPLRTSPVKRGDWVLRRILGTPTPPPPPDAGSLPSDPADFGGMTLRERLTAHKRNPTCANCHLRIDPLGFPLERFDAVGRTRSTYDDGNAVDVLGEFADATTIEGASGLAKYLVSREEQVLKTFARKVLGYALGRTVLASDAPLIAEMTAAGGDATFADLAVKVVTSRQFRNRSIEPVEPATEVASAMAEQ